MSFLSALVLPVPGGLAADLVESLDHPMTGVRWSAGTRSRSARRFGHDRRCHQAVSVQRTRSACQRTHRPAPPCRHRSGVGRRRRASHQAGRQDGYPVGRLARAGTHQCGTRTRRRSVADWARHSHQPDTEGTPGMTEPTTTEHPAPHPPFLQEVKDNLTRVAVPYHEPPGVVLRRRIIVGVCGGDRRYAARLFARPRSRRRVVLRAHSCAGGGLGVRRSACSRPLHLGHVRFFGRNQRPGHQRHRHRPRARRRLRGWRVDRPRDTRAARLRR